VLGAVNVGEGTVIHPKAVINAESGSIVVGENNIIEELSSVVNKYVC
jgi:dynactin 6